MVRQRPEEVKEAFQTLEEAHHVLKHIIRTGKYSAQNILLITFFIARECQAFAKNDLRKRHEEATFARN